MKIRTGRDAGERTNPRAGLALLALALMAAPGMAEEAGLTIGGSISFRKTGSIYVSLVTEEEYGRPGLAEHRFSLVLKPSQAELRAGRMRYAMQNVPAGTYALRAFQDVNGNGRLDSGIFGPTEPWCIYRLRLPAFRAPRFDEIRFELRSSTSSLDLDLI
jgi:uncharacterized protein (DUF2141 family)